ncbi:RNA-guided endonuclease InsQ/TnpB family protein [Methanoculleus sp. UBA430]|uniref:RNA-guided endonuclease InsQ/TnpB family protein n=1 Tax=Methanoculleus sp. UBA430 TaxID=1915511 RepID=UPI00374395A4
MEVKAYRYRLYPTKKQVTCLKRTLDICRWVYINTLAMRKNTWETDKQTSYFETKRQLPIWKREKPELKTVHSQVLQDVMKRVDLALQAFFRRVKNGENPGYPRFKGYGRYDSITYSQSGFHLNSNIIGYLTIYELVGVLNN